MAYPTVYPTGTTVYDPEKSWNGYTLFPAMEKGAALIDMRGNIVQLWEGLQEFPNKLLLGTRGRSLQIIQNMTEKKNDREDWEEAIPRSAR